MLKILSVVVWCLLLFVFTCTANLDDLFHNYVLQFNWVPHPDFTDLFSLKDAKFTSPHYLFQKTGHFLGFAVLAVLLMNIIGKRKKAFVLTLLFAVLTEILQLYFARDGRLLDMAIDSLGIALALYIYDK